MAGSVRTTALAVHWARETAAAVPDGQLYMDPGAVSTRLARR
ncbi:hypothetical protein [Streptomyces sp. NPDC004658]